MLDPGPLIDEHIEAILEAIDGESITHILVTHTHKDHSSAAFALQQRCHAPIVGFGPHRFIDEHHPISKGIDRNFVPDVRITDGEYIEGPDWTLQAIHTPGHCYNHLCYLLPQEKTLFAGDHLMAWSTTVIIAPDGNLGEYVNSLEKVEKIDADRFLPAHGGAIDEAGAYIRATIGHRLGRVREIEQLILDGVNTIDTMAPHLYPRLKPTLQAGAALTILASAIYLIEHNRIACDSDPSLESRFTPV